MFSAREVWCVADVLSVSPLSKQTDPISALFIPCLKPN